MTITSIAPANQRLRINTLRLCAVLLLPVFVMAVPVWHDRIWFRIVELIGACFIVAAVLGRFWCILYIGGQKNRSVIRQGPYSMCRHPLYFFSIIGTLGFGVHIGSVLLTALLTALVTAILIMTARREERYLRGFFGGDYDDYAAATPMILPNPRKFRTDPEITVSIAQLRVNFMDALVFLGFLPIALVLRKIQAFHIVPTFPVW